MENRNTKTMLIQFSVENYRSILDRQTLSLAASGYFKEHLDRNTFPADTDEEIPNLLRSAVIYGPNASGKSTLVNALGFMRRMVVNSAKESQAGEEIEVTPFKLTPASRNGDSEFEITLIEEGIRYQYGFRCNRTRITEEWLFAYPEGRSQRWFHRAYNPDSGKDEYRPFASSFQGGRKRDDWKAQTRPNALFLSTALQLNNEQLKPVLAWFQKRLKVVNPFLGLFGRNYTVRQCKDVDRKRSILEFLNSADIGIADIRVESQPFKRETLPKDMPAHMQEEISREMTGKELTDVKFLHEDSETHELIEFDEEDESDGTRALFGFAGPWLDVMENERILVVDEIDTSLHPLIVHQLVKLFHRHGCKAQLIFTTHDTTLLSQKILRRDQVWFTEKDDRQSARLYPLSDFSPRENEAIEKGYLNGRYGGIPFLKDLDFNGNG